MPEDPRDRQKLAARFFVILQVLCHFVRAQILRNRRRRLQLRQRHGRTSECSFRLEKEFEQLLLAYTLPTRRYWVAPRTAQWRLMVLNQQTLVNNGFEQMFRMTRNSFEQLHGLLGMSFQVMQLT